MLFVFYVVLLLLFHAQLSSDFVPDLSNDYLIDNNAVPKFRIFADYMLTLFIVISVVRFHKTEYYCSLHRECSHVDSHQLYAGTDH